MEIKNILDKNELTKEEIAFLLSLNGKDEIELLRKKAYQVMQEYCGEKVYFRGLIEFSNYCTSDCYYCGIRKSNSAVHRYTLTKEQIVDAAVWCAEKGYGSVVLQSGERNDDKFVDFVEDAVKTIKEKTKSEKQPNGVGLTLCVGEQTLDNYKRLFAAGAHRYLLRIETSNPELFKKIHPPTQSFEERKKSLKRLKEAGFQVGTGVMIGLPEQTFEDLANDILFFKEYDVDMIGMGPFIVHQQTPMCNFYQEYIENKDEIYNLALKMLAVTRIVLKDVNIASTTALQAMNPTGREDGLLFGANVIMPQLTPTEVRRNYLLYEGKPCLDEFADQCFFCLENRIASVGRSVAYFEYGDPKHFFRK